MRCCDLARAPRRSWVPLFFSFVSPTLLAPALANAQEAQYASDFASVPVGDSGPEASGFSDDPDVISPPVLVGPLHACTDRGSIEDGLIVGVQGLLPGARVYLFVNGSPVSIVDDADGEHRLVRVRSSLREGDELTAVQEIVERGDRVTSPLSDPLVVVAPLTSLPRPRLFSTPLYRCGVRVGSRLHVGGSTVRYEDTDGRLRGRAATGPYYAQSGLDAPLELGEKLLAVAEQCGVVSEPSPVEIVRDAPSPLPQPEIEPVYDGADRLLLKHLAPGSRVTIYRREGGTGPTEVYGTWSTAFSMGEMTLDGRVREGDELWAEAVLCDTASPAISQLVPVDACSALPHPDARAPEIGQRVVELTRYAPGARVRVYDADGHEIGDGTGPRVGLVRAVRGDDTLTIVQQVGDCVAPRTLRIAATCKAPIVVDNPVGEGEYEVGLRSYHGGSITVGGEPRPLSGYVYFPSEQPGDLQPAAHGGPFPVVFFQHANGQSYGGYGPLGEALARRGFVFVTMDAGSVGEASTTAIEYRTEIMLRTVELFRDGQTGPGTGQPLSGWASFAEALDFDRLALAGHSRGGEAAAQSAVQLPPRLALDAHGVLLVAPTDYGIGSNAERPPLVDVPVLVVLGAADGDTWGGEHHLVPGVDKGSGIRHYDRALPRVRGTFKSQLYLYGANHNFFVSPATWDDRVPGDPSLPNPALSEEDQFHALQSWATAFFELTLQGRWKYLPVFSGDGYLDETPWWWTYPSYEGPDAFAISRFQSGPVTINDLNRPVLFSSDDFTTFDRFSLRERLSAAHPTPYNEFFFHDTWGLVAVPRRDGASWSQELRAPSGPALPRHRYLSFRAAWVYEEGGVATPPVSLDVRLYDSQSSSAEVSTAGFAALPRAFYVHRPSAGPIRRAKTVMRTIRVPLSCFESPERPLDPRLLIRVQTTIPREETAIVFDDVLLTD